METRYVSLLLVWVALLFATPALAQNADQNAEARVYFEEGNRHLAKADKRRGARRKAALEDALQAYVNSLRIVRSRNAIYNAGLVSEALGRNDAAFGYYKEYLGIPGLSAEDRVAGEKSLASIRKKVAVLAITTDPSSEVYIDRLDLAARGRTPLEVAVTPGEHTVFFKQAFFKDGSKKVVAVVGETIAVDATLEPNPVSVRINTDGKGRLVVDGKNVDGNTVVLLPGEHSIRFEPDGAAAVDKVINVEPTENLVVDVGQEVGASASLIVRSNVPSNVAVDGASVGDGSEVRTQLSPGEHVVTVSAIGHATLTQRMMLKSGLTRTLTATLKEKTGSRFGKLPGALLVIAGASLIGAGVAWGGALINRNNYNDAAQKGVDEADLMDRAKTFALAGDILGGVALGLGITGIILAILNKPKEQTPSTGVLSLNPLRGGAFLNYSLSFGAEL